MMSEGANNVVWVCNFNASRLSRRLDAMQELQSTLDVIKQYERGEPIDPAKMPKAFILRGKTAPADIMISAFLFVSEEVGEILRRFDLGKERLVKLDGIYRGNEKKSLPKSYSILTQQNRKDAFSAIDSDQKWIRKLSRLGSLWGLFVDDAPADAFAVAENALDGPDIWRDPAVPQQMFLSDRLKNALDAQGIGPTLELKRCRVVPLQD